MRSPWKLSAMHYASGLGLLLLLSAHSQVWPWLVSEKQDARRLAERGEPARSPNPQPDEPRRRPLAVLATLPDPSPLRNALSVYSATHERSASVERGSHAAGSRDGIGSGSVPVDAAPLILAQTIVRGPAALVGQPHHDPRRMRARAIGTSIMTLAPPA